MHERCGCQEVEASFQEGRRFAVQPGRKSYEEFNLTTFSQRKRYADFYHDCDVYTLDEYLAEHAVQPDIFSNEQQKIRYIEQEPGIRVANYKGIHDFQGPSSFLKLSGVWHFAAVCCSH